MICYQKFNADNFKQTRKQFKKYDISISPSHYVDIKISPGLYFHMKRFLQQRPGHRSAQHARNLGVAGRVLKQETAMAES